MKKIPGSIKIQTDTHWRLFKNRDWYNSILDSIEGLTGVKEVWFTDFKDFDLLAEVEVDRIEDGDKIATKIKKIQGIKDAHPYIALTA
jgi:hypothetical protein